MAKAGISQITAASEDHPGGLRLRGLPWTVKRLAEQPLQRHLSDAHFALTRIRSPRTCGSERTSSTRRFVSRMYLRIEVMLSPSGASFRPEPWISIRTQ